MKKRKSRNTKLSMSEQIILNRNIIKDIVENSIKIAEFNSNHKKNQQIFENRLIKNEKNYINPDSKFTGKIHVSLKKEKNLWIFISKSIGKIITVEQNSEIKLHEFNTKKYKIYMLNKNNDEDKIIAAEIYEHQQRAD